MKWSIRAARVPMHRMRLTKATVMLGARSSGRGRTALSTEGANSSSLLSTAHVTPSVAARQARILPLRMCGRKWNGRVMIKGVIGSTPREAIVDHTGMIFLQGPPGLTDLQPKSDAEAMFMTVDLIPLETIFRNSVGRVGQLSTAKPP